MSSILDGEWRMRRHSLSHSAIDGRVYCRLRTLPMHKEGPVAAPRYSRQVTGAFCVLALGALLAACASVAFNPGGDATSTLSPDVTATTRSQTPTPAPAGGCQPRVTAAAPIL